MSFWYIDTSTSERKTVTCSTLDFISILVPHIPPKGMQMVHYAGLYARNLKHKIAPFLLAALEALSLQFPLFDIQALILTSQHLTWRERIKASFGYVLLNCPRCGRTLELVEIWEPKRGHIWIETLARNPSTAQGRSRCNKATTGSSPHPLPTTRLQLRYLLSSILIYMLQFPLQISSQGIYVLQQSGFRGFPDVYASMEI